MNDQQTVTDKVDDQGKPASEAGGAPEKTVDDLLKEFDTKAEPTTDTAPEKDDRLDRVFDYVERKATQEVAEQTTQDIDKAVKTAIGDSGLHPKVVEGMLHHRANTDPAFAKAWMGRHEKPEQFQEVLRRVGKEFATELTSNIDPNVTEDRVAVSAAVRSHNTKPAEAPPSDKDFRRMSDSELAAHKRKLLRG